MTDGDCRIFGSRPAEWSIEGFAAAAYIDHRDDDRTAAGDGARALPASRRKCGLGLRDGRAWLIADRALSPGLHRAAGTVPGNGPRCGAPGLALRFGALGSWRPPSRRTDSARCHELSPAPRVRGNPRARPAAAGALPARTDGGLVNHRHAGWRPRRDRARTAVRVGADCRHGGSVPEPDRRHRVLSQGILPPVHRAGTPADPQSGAATGRYLAYQATALRPGRPPVGDPAQ